MNPNRPRHRGWRTKEQARKKKHDVPAPPNPVAPPPPRNPMAPPPPRNPQQPLMFLEDIIASSKMQEKGSTSSAAKDKGKSVADPLLSQDTTSTSSPATTNNTSDGDYVPPPSFEYNEEVQSRYTAHRIRAGKAKVGESSSQPKKVLKLRGEGRKTAANPSLYDARSPLPKPKPQVLGLVCKRAQEYAEGKDLKERYFPDTEELVFLLKGDHLWLD